MCIILITIHFSTHLLLHETYFDPEKAQMSQESPWPFLQGISICVNEDVYLMILLEHGINFHHAQTDC